MNVVRLSTLHTGRLYPQEDISDTHFCLEADALHGRGVAGRIMSMKSTERYLVGTTMNFTLFVRS